MGKDFFRLVELALASGALLIPGVGIAGDATARPPEPAKAAPDRSVPVVRSARLDRDGLTIQVSEPLRALAGVDPSKFRLTFAYYSRSRPGGYSYYHEYYGYYRARRSVTVYSDVGRAALGDRVERPLPTQIRIPASPELSLTSICGEIAAAPAKQEHAGLYLHYAAGASQRIESASGAALASIAPYWLTKEGTTTARGSFQGRPIPVAVSCP